LTLKVRDRIITVKGRKYRQKVSYIWDHKAKKGKTIVVKHVGPVFPAYRKRGEAQGERESKIELTDYNSISFNLDNVEVWRGKVIGSGKNSSILRLPANWKDRYVWVVLPRGQ
jgi:hypothetical protein